MSEQTRRIIPGEIDAIRELLRHQNVRATPARIAVMQELRRATSPLTHADVADQLVPLGFDKATVFRNLADLTDAGLLFRTELGDHVWRFEVLDPSRPGSEKHPHFVCIDCGGVTCLKAIEFTAGSKRQAKIIGDVTEVLLKGHCVKCASA